MKYSVTENLDLPYIESQPSPQLLNLYVPATPQRPPTVLYLHGGGWQRGDRTTDVENRIRPAAASGLAVATIDYRLAPNHRHPAQVHDVKAAIRWLRANAARYGIAAEELGIWGASAGAMLGSLVALTAGDAELEGRLGDHLDQSSAVQAAVHWFGPVDFVSSSTRSPMESRILPAPVDDVLWGDHTAKSRATTRRDASPLARVSIHAPPFLIVHGDRDRLTPVNEATVFHEALARAGVVSNLLRLGDAGHEDRHFEEDLVLSATTAFLRSALNHDPTGQQSPAVSNGGKSYE